MVGIIDFVVPDFEESGETTELLPSKRPAEFLSSSMENIPRVHSFGCLSLKIGSVISACLLIVYSVLALAKCMAAFTNMGWSELDPTQWKDSWSGLAALLLLTATAIHIATLSLTALMLIGALREKAHQMRPWVVWSSVQVTAYCLLFVFLLVTSMLNHAEEKSFVICLIEFLGLMIRFYMLIIVASYYRVLQDEGTDGERHKALGYSDLYYHTV